VDAFYDLPFKPLLELRTGPLQFWDTIDNVDRQVEAIDLVADGEFQWSVDVALFLVPANVDIGVVGSSISELMDQPGISMEVEDHRLVSRKE
jgi:hypothetical protein